MAVKSLKNATLQIRDGTGTPKVVTLRLGTGNITWTENYGYEYEAERGNIANGTVRATDEQPVDVNVTTKWENIIYGTADPLVDSGDENVTPYEALTKTGAASSWATTGADSCEPYSCELYIEFDVDCSGSSVLPEKVTFGEFRCESCAFDVQAGTLVFSGKSKEVRPSVVRESIT